MSVGSRPDFTVNLIETSPPSLDGKPLVSMPINQLNAVTNLISEDSVNQFGHDHEFTKLVIDLKGKDPDDSFSSIPYEKVLYEPISSYLTANY